MTVECGAANRAASERMSSTTSTCNSECVQCTCAKDSALPTDQCLSICLLHCRYDSDEDRHAAYLFSLQARKACQSHARQQRKLLQRYRSVYHVSGSHGQLDACLHHTWPHLPHYPSATYACMFQCLVLHFLATLLRTERVCSHCWYALTNFDARDRQQQETQRLRDDDLEERFSPCAAEALSQFLRQVSAR